MIIVSRYRGREITEKDLALIKNLIKENPQLNRKRLSIKLCQIWNWVQPNGSLKDMVCRGLMLKLHREGHIVLPPPRPLFPNLNTNPLARRGRRSPLKKFSILPQWEEVGGKLSSLRPLEFRQVRRTSWEGLFAQLMEAHHYLGYTQPVGEHLKYLVLSRGIPLACLAFSSAPRHIGPRDRFIGWSPHVRKKNLHLIAYNTRFLILPHVKVKYLATHILGRVAKVLPKDWQKVYHHPVHYLETFVDPQRFRGTCYRAANWIYHGLTTGRGKDAPTQKPTRNAKEIWGYPISRRFRAFLGSERES